MKMKVSAIIAIASVCMLVACSPNQEKMQAEIGQFEAELSKMDVLSETTNADKLFNMYSKYVSAFPSDDSLAPIYLFRMSEIEFNKGNISGALSLIDSVINNYENFEDLGGCLFYKGQLLQAAGEYSMATNVFETFIERFPDHPLATDTRKMLELDMIEMSPEEMLETVLANAGNNPIAE